MSANPQNASPFQSAGRELTKLGYSVAPIMPGQKFPGMFANGNWRPLAGWQQFQSRPPKAVDLMRWSTWPRAGVGIVLGSSVGNGTVVIAIDLDMRDPKQVARAVAALPATPMSKTGAKGETLFFRASPEIKTRVFDKILDEIDESGRHKRERLADLLAGGRQTVVPPSHHPDGLEYRWLRGPVPAADLPLFDDRALKAFEGVMQSLGWSPDPQTSAPPGVTRAPKPAALRSSGDNVIDFTSSVHKRLNAAALANLDAWVPDLELFRCERARAGYEAVATWRSSSTGRPDAKRKRNLSIQPNGIEDFGAATKCSPLDLVMCAKGLTFNEAYEWLRERITPDDDSGVVMALQIPGRSEGAPQNVSTENVTEESEAPPPMNQETPSFFGDDKGLAEWPDDMCFPAGLVGSVARWIVQTSTKPCPLLAYGAALALVGTIAGRQFEGPTGTGTHLYVIGVAPTGAGKDHPMECVKIALSDANMANMIGPSDYTADSAVLGYLVNNPLTISIMDEFGSFWKRISSKRSGTWETAITRALREPWSRSFGLMRTKQYAGAGPQSQDIWWPALSIFGMTTPGEFFNALTGSDVENGMANRFLLLATSRRAYEKRTYEERRKAYYSRSGASLKTPKHIVDGMISIRDWQGPIVGPQFTWPATTRPKVPTIKCTISEDADKLLFDYSEWIGERSIESEQFGKFYSRGAESAQRVAMIHAIGRAVGRDDNDKRPPQIEEGDVEHAIRLVDWSLRMLWTRVANSHVPSGMVEISRKMTEVIRDIGFGNKMSQRDLRRAIGAVTDRDFQEAAKYLQEAEIIGFEKDGPSNKRGRRTTWYWLIDDPGAL